MNDLIVSKPTRENPTEEVTICEVQNVKKNNKNKQINFTFSLSILEVWKEIKRLPVRTAALLLHTANR